MAFAAGQLLGGRFRLVNRIGADALGEIWRATDRVPSAQVDIHMVTPNAPVSRAAIETFLGEMRTACVLRHGATARVIDVGQGASSVPWFAIEPMRGESLEQVLARRSVISPAAALKLIAELAEAVAEAHGLGLVHRGLHPRSVILHVEDERTPSVKLVDFGRERLFASSTESRMQGYRSVELSLGARATKESDVWALGVMLFRCVTGKLPFASLADTTTQSHIDRIVGERVRDPALGIILRDCLRYAREERITAAELADRAQLLGSTSPGAWHDVEDIARVAIVPEKARTPLPALFEPIVDAPHAARASDPVRPALPYEGVFDIWIARRKRALAALFGVAAAIGGGLGAVSHLLPNPKAIVSPHIMADRASALPARPQVAAPPTPTNCAAPPVVPATATATAVATPIAPPPPPKRVFQPAVPKPKPPVDDDNPYE